MLLFPAMHISNNGKNSLVAEPPQPTTWHPESGGLLLDLGPFGNLDEFMAPPGLEHEVKEEVDQSQDENEEPPT